MNPLDLKEYSGSIGLPMPSTEIALRDDDRKDVPLGQPGEICITRPAGDEGLLAAARGDRARCSAPTASCYTGDVGVMDEKGFVRIVDRKKDMILVSGFNVYPNEIEQVVAMHARACSKWPRSACPTRIRARCRRCSS